MPRGVALMGLMKKSSAQEEYVTVSLHKGKRFLEQKLSIWPDNQTALTQVIHEYDKWTALHLGPITINKNRRFSSYP